MTSDGTRILALGDGWAEDESVDTIERLRRIVEAGATAARRAAEVRLRIAEIQQRLALLHTGDTAVRGDQATRAKRAADLAVTHTVESRRRARLAHETAAASHDDAARAHEAAASAHRRLAASGVGDVEAHRRSSEAHLSQAATDRAAGEAERSRCSELYAT